MGHHLIQENIVTKEFLTSVLREKIYLRRILIMMTAIPHPLRPESKRINDFDSCR